MKHKKVMALRLLVFALLFGGFAGCVSAAEKGVVIAMGGGNGTPEIYEKWKALGGGQNAHVVLIPTANNPGEDIAPVVNGLKQVFGVQEVAVLDTKDRARADSDEFVAPLKEATFVFIDGGRQWRLADAYLGTRVERELRNVLKRGGVIAGSSAGASILASYLVRGDPAGAEIMMAKGACFRASSRTRLGSGCGGASEAARHWYRSEYDYRRTAGSVGSDRHRQSHDNAGRPPAICNFGWRPLRPAQTKTAVTQF